VLQIREMFYTTEFSYPPETLQRILNSGSTEIVDLFVRHNLVPYDVKHKDAMRREFLARSLDIHDPEEIAKKFVFLCTGDDAKFVTTLAAEMTIRQLIDQGLFERHFSERFKQFTDQIRGTTRLADQFRMVKALSEKIVELVDNPVLAARSVTDISHPEQILSLGDLATLTHKAHTHIATHTCSPEDVAFLDEFIFRSISHITRKNSNRAVSTSGIQRQHMEHCV
jgi:hypothetical protein